LRLNGYKVLTRILFESRNGDRRSRLHCYGPDSSIYIHQYLAYKVLRNEGYQQTNTHTPTHTHIHIHTHIHTRNPHVNTHITHYMH